jgi:hypothetical protein
LIDDTPGWVLADVCAIEGGPPRLIVSEPGLYKLLQTSRKPQAKRFDRWVRHWLPDRWFAS